MRGAGNKIALGKVKAELDEHGYELMDSVPVAPPLGYKKQPSLADQIRDMVKGELLRREVEAQGKESFDEADDFDVDDDDTYDPSSPYEEVFEPDNNKGSAEAGGSPEPSPASPEPAVQPEVADKKG